eukprot:360870-Chlamydomonas_euryale.AAC.6
MPKTRPFEFKLRTMVATAKVAAGDGFVLSVDGTPCAAEHYPSHSLFFPSLPTPSHSQTPTHAPPRAEPRTHAVARRPSTGGARPAGRLCICAVGRVFWRAR